MKPTDEERREVATRLRELEIHCWYDGMDEIDSLETAIGCAIGQDWQDQDWWNRLADLIEPEPERTCKNLSSGFLFVCSECNGQVTKWRVMPSYCPDCGAKIISGKDTDVITSEKMMK